ncbi:MAG: zinc-binding alcohol dehydrogenase family protein [Actinobacteria bacterium]|nr:zinc-binding alcohol dehydrogenase family protein [Actinomycetota bacterium]
MRAAVLPQYGLPVAGEWPEPPEPGRGQAVVAVSVAGVNPVDVNKAAGRFYSGNRPIPSIAGSEGVGTLDDGRRVYFDAPVDPFGSIAERALIDAQATFGVPDGLDDGLACALGIAGLAGWLSLERGGLRPGEHVLVLGSGGTVGQIAAQAAKLMGAGRVVVATRSPESLADGTRSAADAVVELGDVETLTERVREAAAGRLDLVIDPLWGAPAVAALDALDGFGRLVQLGQSAAPVAEFAAADVRGASRSILGYSTFNLSRDVKRAAYERLASHALAGELSVDVERVPLALVSDAFERQMRAPHRKLVIEL